ncbi:unnamed protein product [Ilex paraguariensis]|uniref:Uncharacterized protein n=1 Tax=Ilex paraguariensis TaxID=185542 RepID=A0ABC8RLN1_9AQUA
MINEMLDGKKQEDLEFEKSLITRSLLLDFSEKSEASDSSGCSSSMQVLEIKKDLKKSTYYEDGEEVEADDGGLVDELCEGICKINVNCETTVTKFTGKLTRFVYNSDDELEGEEECGDGESESTVSMGILRLKGLPTPEGKHLRFPEDLEED